MRDDPGGGRYDGAVGADGLDGQRGFIDANQPELERFERHGRFGLGRLQDLSRRGADCDDDSDQLFQRRAAGQHPILLHGGGV